MPGLAELKSSPNKYNPSDEEILKDEKALALTNPLFIVQGCFLSIKTKAGQLLRLKLNKPQRYLFQKIIELRKLKIAIRLWVLKSRQEGISTLIEAIIYALTSQQENRNSLIMADEEDKADYLFGMSKLYQEQLETEEPHLAPELKKSNAKTLEFENLHSQIIIETAKNVNATRAFTYQYVHLSEVARFPDLKGVLGGLMQSVPDHSDTIVIGETTANGINEFYEEWDRATKGLTNWLPIFIPWFWMGEYALALQNNQLWPLDGVHFDSEYTSRIFLEEEQKIKSKFSLTDEQLNWRRWAIVNKCQGDVILFKQEYPSTPEEAFAKSGEMFFDKDGLEKQTAIQPKSCGEILQENLKWIFRATPHGRIKIYAEPEKQEEYLVVTDASEGIIGRDTASALVLNKRTNKTEAIVKGPYTPEELAQMAIALGNYYNQAIIVPENKGYGYMVAQIVYQNYGRIYRRIITKTGSKDQKEELGWNTNTVTRPQMLAQLNEEIKNHSTELVSQDLIDECKVFIVNPETKKPEAQEGYQDGLVICRAIAGMVRQQYPYIKKRITQEQEFKSIRNL